MKRLFNILGTILVGAMFLTSCADPEVTNAFASELTVDATELTFVGQGAANQTVNVTANGDWVVTTPEWISATPNFGSGNAAVVIAVADNLDTDNTLAGSRSGKVAFMANSIEVDVVISQSGDKAKDKQRTYNKVSKITSGKAYLIVAKDADGLLQAASPIAATKTYGYLSPTTVEESNNVINTADGSCGFVFTAVEGGYTIAQSDGRLVYQSGSYNSFNFAEAPADGQVWTVDFQSDGTAKITNVAVSKYMQYSSAYSSYGSYAAAQDNASVPTLYEDTKEPEVMESLGVKKTAISVDADATSATISVVANVDWTVSCTDAWITDYTKSGSNSADITVSFAAYTDETNDRTATFTITGVEQSATVTLTQKHVVLATSIFSETFGTSQGAFTVDNKLMADGMTSVWNYDSTNLYMKASAYYNKTNTAAESWLISPEIDLTGSATAILTFDHVYRYAGTVTDELTLQVTSDNGTTWTAVTIPTYSTGTNWTFVSSGDIDFAAYTGKKIKFAFKYLSSTTAAGTWEIKNVLLMGTSK